MRPLEGHKVFDFTAMKSGPYCTMILADFGAEVIDVDNIMKPDASRRMKPSYQNTSTEYIAIHRGKESIELNTKTEDGIKIARKIISQCDIFVENGKPGSAAKMGLGYEDVKKIRPDVIYCSISGFGQNGPYRDRVAFDTVIQAMSGFMSLTGPESGEFTKGGPSMSDISTGICAALCIAMAVIHRDKTGEGTFIDCSMLDCFAQFNEAAIAAYLNAGEERHPMGNRHPANAIAEPVRCKDGEFILQMFGNEQHQRFCKALDIPDFTQDPRFADGPQRVENRDVLVHEIVEPVLQKYTLKEISAILRENNIPFGEMYTIKQLMEDEQFKARETLITATDSVNGTFKIYGSPYRFSAWEMPKETFSDQPGEHNYDVLERFCGMSKDEVDAAMERMGKTKK